MSYKWQIPVEIDKNPEGATTVGVGLPFKCLDGEIGQTDSEMEEPGTLHLTVTPPRRKIPACRWYLQQLMRCIQNESSALMFLEALVSELRSSTFSLQKLCSRSEGFDSWYKERQDGMRSDPDLSWVVELRNAAQKEGLVIAIWGQHAIVRFYRNGEVQAHLQVPIFRLEGVSSEVQLPRLQAAIDKIGEIVEEAHRLFVSPSPRPIESRVDYVREQEDGAWEYF
jgi:hypothetical protein